MTTHTPPAVNRHLAPIELGRAYRVSRYPAGTGLVGILESFDGAGEMVHVRVIRDTGECPKPAGALVTVHYNQLETTRYAA